MVYLIAIVAYKVVPVGGREDGNDIMNCRPILTVHIAITIRVAVEDKIEELGFRGNRGIVFISGSGV